MTVFGSHNVCSNPAHPDTIERTFQIAAEGVSVIMWQECDADIYGANLAHALPSLTHYWGGDPHARTANPTEVSPHFASPISYDRNIWGPVAGGNFLFQAGHAGWSFPRYWTWLLLQEKATKRNYMFHSGHYVRLQGDDPAGRLEEWKTGQKVVLAHIHDLQKKYAAPPMVVGIDANTTNTMFIGHEISGYPVHEQIHHIIDWMFFIDGKGHPWEIPAHGPLELRETGSDHEAMVVKGAWTHPAPLPVVKPRPVDAKWPISLGYRQPMASRPGYIHRGVDYEVPVGTPVYSTTDGVVVYAGEGGGNGPYCGIHVIVKKSDTRYVCFYHLSREDCYVGQKVNVGTQIGLSGATGNVTGPHLHYQVQTGGPGQYTTDINPDNL